MTPISDRVGGALAQIKADADAGIPHAEIARRYGISRSTVARHVGPAGTRGRPRCSHDTMQARIVELMVAGGRTAEEVAGIVGTTKSTVVKRWALAKRMDPTLRRGRHPRRLGDETKARIIEMARRGERRRDIARALGVLENTVRLCLRAAHAADPTVPRSTKPPPLSEEERRRRNTERCRRYRGALKIVATAATKAAAEPDRAKTAAPRLAPAAPPPSLPAAAGQTDLDRLVAAAIAAGVGARYERIAAAGNCQRIIKTGPEAAEYLQGLGFSVTARVKAGRISHYRVSGGSELDAKGWMLVTPFVAAVRAMVAGTAYRRIPLREVAQPVQMGA